MKKSIVILFVMMCVSFTLNVHAQMSRNLQFVYIDHEVTTPTNKLCQQLKSLRDDANETKDVLIIYLSTGISEQNYGMVSLTNVEDPNSEENSTEEAFNNIIAALQNTNYHSVDPKKDVANILRIFDWCNFLNDQRQLTFSNVTMDFYVSSNFWLLGYEHSIISHLYTDFDVESLPKASFSFNVFKPRDVELKHKEGTPFGTNNLQNINNNIRIKSF